ncbi:phage tail tip lysozyme [Methylobacterium sp. NEAU 140]|uniref:phage tail tip lysozyme n=1 Tax=Methylobacterium sp. NEAU 140 TaxID=3064945 RepID=UPI002736681A|nr:phage tail tip lysozyme [Methylobacterium sp. NEAU 140]MDP4024468.1 phage tail tip lysozyme [Methylobacterium sp. NEAU 140]
MTPQFRAAVTAYGPRFMADLGLDKLETAGIFGNLAVESDQFRALQEYKPVVSGSRGGWGWPQWTGPRRRQFEAWAAAKHFKLDDPEAFYQYMLVELRGPEAVALGKLRATTTLDRATEAFMLGYERPGTPHLDRRKAFALEALHVLEAALAERANLNRALDLPPPVVPVKVVPVAVPTPPKGGPTETPPAPRAGTVVITTPPAPKPGWLAGILQNLRTNLPPKREG